MISKKILIFIVFLVVSFGGILFWKQINALIPNHQTQRINKEYRSEAGKVKIIDNQSKKEIATIDLSAKEEDFTIQFTPHAITLTPDKKQVWITASASQDQLGALHKNAKEHTHFMMTSDQVVVIDSSTNSIKERITMGNNIQLSDIVLTHDNKYAYITAENGNAIYKVNASNFKVEQMIQLPPQTLPHEIAISSDNTKVYTRNSEKNAIVVISTETNKVISRMKSNDPLAEEIDWSKH